MVLSQLLLTEIRITGNLKNPSWGLILEWGIIFEDRVQGLGLIW